MDNRMQTRQNSGLDDPLLLPHVIPPGPGSLRGDSYPSMKHLIGSIRRRRLALFLALAPGGISAGFLRSRKQGASCSIDRRSIRGTEDISRDRILAQIRTAVGQPYSDAVVEQDIRNLYKTGQVQNVRIFGRAIG